MSIYGSVFANDMEEDMFFGSHMRTMRQMNNMMNSLFADPFSMMGGLNNRALTHNSLMPFGFPPMPSFNRLLGGNLAGNMGGLGGNLDSLTSNLLNGHSYSSSTVVSMTSGPDGRPQVYKATQSTRTAPGGVKETQKTVCDSRTGTKKMAIGHHIGDRAHIIEREQNMRSGDQEERQDFINIEEDEAEDFNKEWETKARARSDLPLRIGSGGYNRHSYGGSSGLPAITAGASSSRRRDRHSGTPLVTPRRSIRSSPLALPPNGPGSSSSTGRRPYSPPGQPQPRKSKNIKTVSGSSPSLDM